MKKITIKDSYSRDQSMIDVEKYREILDIENSPECIQINLSKMSHANISTVGFVFEIYSTCKNKNIPCQIIPPENKNMRKFFSPILEVTNESS